CQFCDGRHQGYDIAATLNHFKRRTSNKRPAPQGPKEPNVAEAKNNRWGHLALWALVGLGAYWMFFA
ncbi:MAG: hypothetical protein ACR2O3_03635, partial [Rhizobiaceae bacterium]